MTALIGWLLDVTPWWAWALASLALLGATYQVWAPLWALAPSWLRTGALGLASIVLAYLAGRNRGASGALDRAKQQEAAHADRITEAGRRARADADALNVGERLRDDDGWRRD